MLPKLKEIQYQGDCRVWLKFADGVTGEADFENELWSEMFEPLKDIILFAELTLTLDEELGTIVWPTGADFAPEFLYQQLCPYYSLKPSPAKKHPARDDFNHPPPFDLPNPHL